jgi:hypothetical protein
VKICPSSLEFLVGQDPQERHARFSSMSLRRRTGIPASRPAGPGTVPGRRRTSSRLPWEQEAALRMPFVTAYGDNRSDSAAGPVQTRPSTRSLTWPTSKSWSPCRTPEPVPPDSIEPHSYVPKREPPSTAVEGGDVRTRAVIVRSRLHYLCFSRQQLSGLNPVRIPFVCPRRKFSRSGHLGMEPASDGAGQQG